LLGNRLLAPDAGQHYVQGVTLGQLASRLDVGYGTLIGAWHPLARRLEPVCERLGQEYRKSPLKHARETGWRTDGHNGSAWLLGTPRLRLFRFRQSRSGQSAQQVLGTQRPGGMLVGDRSLGSHHAPFLLASELISPIMRPVDDAM
jgi:hypothetical protein